MSRLQDLWTALTAGRSVDAPTAVGDDGPWSGPSRPDRNRAGSGSLAGCVIVHGSSPDVRPEVAMSDGGAEVAGGVDDLEWALETTLSPRDIRAAGVAALAGGPWDGAVRENLANAGSVSYAVVDPESLATQMTVVVSWHELGGDRRRVTLGVRGHVVSRTRLFGVLPVGRPSVPALGPAQRFSAALRTRLATV